MLKSAACPTRAAALFRLLYAPPSMFVTYRGTVLGLLRWQWRYAAIYTAAATIVVALDLFEHLTWIELSPLPLGVIGGAIGIFVSFRTNSCYDRWWEGRRLWGQLVNTSRHFATQVLTYTVDDGDAGALKRAIVHSHIGYVHVLRCLLRSQDPWKDADVVRFVAPDELATLAKESNPTHAILHLQTDRAVALNRMGALDDFRLTMVDRSIATLLDVQGGCERIKRTPFPPGYGFAASRLVLAYSFLLPLGIVHDLGWVTVPISVIVCMGFTVISEVGRVLEDPFTMFWPALPLSALSKTIEINLRQRLGESDLPALPAPDERGILM
jgi:putative membrane protein